jgi:hypothetical protein
MVDPTGPLLRQNCKPCLFKSEMMPGMASGKLVFRWLRITPLYLEDHGKSLIVQAVDRPGTDAIAEAPAMVSTGSRMRRTAASDSSVRRGWGVGVVEYPVALLPQRRDDIGIALGFLVNGEEPGQRCVSPYAQSSNVNRTRPEMLPQRDQ